VCADRDLQTISADAASQTLFPLAHRKFRICGGAKGICASSKREKEMLVGMHVHIYMQFQRSRSGSFIFTPLAQHSLSTYTRAAANFSFESKGTQAAGRMG